MTILKFSSSIFGAPAGTGLSTNLSQGRDLAEFLRTELNVLNYKTDKSVAKMPWGWCFFVQYLHQHYMIGTLAYAEHPVDAADQRKRLVPITYLVQFDKKRSFLQRLLRKNYFGEDEPIIDLTAAILKAKITDMTAFSIELGT